MAKTAKTAAQIDREIAQISFEEAKAERRRLEEESEAAGVVLRRFPRGPTGLTPDAVKATPEYRNARARFDRSFARLQAFNGVFVKRFDKELRAERAGRAAASRSTGTQSNSR